MQLSAPGTVMNRIWETKIKNKYDEVSNANLAAGIKKAMLSKYIFFTLAVDVYMYLQSNDEAKCLIQELPAEYNVVGLGVGMRKNLPYKKLIDYQ